MAKKRLYVFTSSRRPISQGITSLLGLYIDSIKSTPSIPNPIISMSNPNMSHGYRFMQRCFASCIGYEVSNALQYGFDEQVRNFIAAVRATGATAPGGADSKKQGNGRKKWISYAKKNWLYALNKFYIIDPNKGTSTTLSPFYEISHISFSGGHWDYSLWAPKSRATPLAISTRRGVSCTCKAIPLQAWTGPEGSSRLRLPDFKTICKWRW